MQKRAESKKEKTIETIAISTLALEVSKGHLKWKVTDLEAKAKISRSLIYSYLGNTKVEILKNALDVFGVYFYGFNEDSTDIPLAERVRRSKEFLSNNPESILFYHKWRSSSHWIGDAMIKAEDGFKSKLKRIYPKLDNEGAKILHAYLHGLVLAPFIGLEQAEKGATDLELLLKLR